MVHSMFFNKRRFSEMQRVNQANYAGMQSTIAYRGGPPRNTNGSVYPWPVAQETNENIDPYAHMMTGYQPNPNTVFNHQLPTPETNGYGPLPSYIRLGNPQMGHYHAQSGNLTPLEVQQPGEQPLKSKRFDPHTNETYHEYHQYRHPLQQLPTNQYPGYAHGHADGPPRACHTMPAGPFDSGPKSTPKVRMTRDGPQIPPMPVVSESTGSSIEQSLLQIKFLNPTSFSGSYGPAHEKMIKYFDAKKPNEKYQFLTTLPDPVAIGASVETVRKLEQFLQFHVLPKTYFSGVTKAVMKEFLDTLQPNQVAVVFQRGTRAAKIDKNLLCSKSNYFANAFAPNYNFKEARNRCIRLRDDYPCGVKAMLSWVVDGQYSIDFETGLQNQHMTDMDLHIHAYIVADKYDMPNLADYAVEMYIFAAAGILSKELPSDLPNMSTGPVNQHARHITRTPHKMDESPSAKVDRFFDSVVLLWKCTGSDDPFRTTVLEIMKPCLPKLMRLRMFGTLIAELTGFCTDLANSLEDDGLAMDARPRLDGSSSMLSFYK